MGKSIRNIMEPEDNGVEASTRALRNKCQSASELYAVLVKGVFIKPHTLNDVKMNRFHKLVGSQLNYYDQFRE
ncbi:hypothetical protein scyTo_0018454 [Scyliorhinus torazame]|uniref:Uncharacterized protein n=1 Tax=Scyliorhinus torazame TaxID=75743 RepID=A0A401PW68_SCYTO|nr:hypothetical protein [Scyliorhinus torazame]